MLAWIESSMALLYPREGELPGVEECDLHEFLLQLRRESPPLVWLGVVLGAVVFQLTPIWTVRRPVLARWLPADLGDRHAHALASTDTYLLGQATFLLKLFAGIAWGQSAAVRARLGMQPLPSDPESWRTS